jgi:NitT/TauT family transport system substrate-binding protein
MRWGTLVTLVVPLLVAACAPNGARPPSPASQSAAPGAPAVAPAPGQSTAPNATPPPVRVRVGLQNISLDLPIFLGIERGDYAQEGLDVEIVNFANASEMIPALATDQLDMAGVSTNPALWNSVARGVPLKLVLEKGSFRPGHGTTALVIRKDLYDAGRYRRLEDLRGLNLGFSPPGQGTTNAAILAYALQPTGLGIEDVTITPLPFPDMVPALANGSLDGGVISEPFQTRTVRQGSGVRVMGQDEMYPGFTVNLLGFAAAFYGNRPAAKGFTRGYLRAVRAYDAAFAHNRPGEGERAQIEETLARHTQTEVQVVRDIIAPGFSLNGLPNVDSLLYSYQYFRQQNQIPEPVPDAAFGALWGTELVEEVLSEVGRLPES